MYYEEAQEQKLAAYVNQPTAKKLYNPIQGSTLTSIGLMTQLESAQQGLKELHECVSALENVLSPVLCRRSEDLGEIAMRESNLSNSSQSVICAHDINLEINKIIGRINEIRNNVDV